MKTSRTLAFALLALVVPGIARAQAVNEASGKVEAPSQWYGWQTLSTDGAALTLVIMGAAVAGNGNDSAGEIALYGSVATYALGGPIVHMAHEQWGRAAGSLGLRIGLPLVLGGAGVAMESCGSRHSDFCGLSGFVIGFGSGLVAAIAADAAFLAYDSRPAEERRILAPPQPSFSFQVTPTVSPDAKHAGLAVSGAF